MKKIVLLILFPFVMYGQTQIGQDIDGEAAGDGSGRGVLLSSDGSILAIGARYNDGNGEDSGHVRIFENQDNTWTQIGDAINGEVAGDESGSRISLSSDGTIIAIGTPFNDDNGEDSGHVRIFENVNNTWMQIGDDIDGNDLFDNFGRRVNLSSDGTTVAFSTNENVDGLGSVRVYENINDIWTQVGNIINGEGEGDSSGTGIGLSSDGSILAIGAPFNDDNGNNSGHVRVYENQDNNWVQIGDDIDGEAEDNWSGFSLGLSSDGNIVAIGALFNNDNGNFSGQVRIYENVGNVWNQVGQDINGEAQGDESGASISLSSDGSIIAIGAKSNDGNGTFSGHARIYKNIDGIWVQVGNDIDGETEFSQASIVALSPDGNTVAIGGPGNSDNGNLAGHVRVFDLSDLLSVEEITQSPFSIYPNPATTQITIAIQNESRLQKTIIYNSLGQVVRTSKETTIYISDLSKGIYIVEVITNQGKSSRKLIIE